MARGRVKTFCALRGVVAAHGMTLGDLADRMLMTHNSMSNRFCMRNPWDINEMYAIMDMFKLPYDQLHIYFPPDGIAQEDAAPQAL